MSYCNRFICKMKRLKHNTGDINITERRKALNSLIKIVQHQSYSKEIAELRKSKSIYHNSSIASLAPFLDEDGLLRVGGRLKNSDQPYNQRHQIILPNHHLTTLIANFYHHINLHCGSQQLLFALRQLYWPIKGRNLTRKITRNCLICFKTNPKPYLQLMGNLPKQRVTPSCPFTFTGVDFAGPFQGRDRRARGYKTYKTYVCLFICFSTKAIHLEAVLDLTAQAFLAALRRFIARRGTPIKIISDNGTNFVGANSELKRLAGEFSKWSSYIDAELSKEGNGIKWEFIPPRSPHFGGLWEANIKIMKRHLTKIVGQTILTFEEFTTVLAQVEGVLNSRPLTPLSNDPSDLNPLTPAHFLIGRPITSAPDEDLKATPSNRLATFQRMQQLTQQFWSRWKREYINQLQIRNKWKTTNPQQLREGLLVLVIEPNEPPATWRMGRISKLISDQDNVVRTVMIKTARGEIKRAVSKVCVLPNQD